MKRLIAAVLLGTSAWLINAAEVSHVFELCDPGPPALYSTQGWCRSVLSMPLVEDVADTTATAKVNVESGKGSGTLYLYVNQSVTPPSEADHKSGTGAAFHATPTVSAAGLQTVNVTGLTLGGTYYAHWLHEWEKRSSSQVTSNSFQTSGEDPADVVLTTDFGLDPWVSPGPDGTIYGASQAKWRFRNNNEDNPTDQATCSEPFVNMFPIKVRNFDNEILRRPLLLGEVSLTAVWGHIYGPSGDCNSATIETGLPTGGGENIIIDGARITRTWDGIRNRSRDSKLMTVKNVWMSRSRDDCIEADGKPPLVVESSLFDGCFQGISMRPGTSTTQSLNTMTVEDSLFKMWAHNHSEGDGGDPRFVHGQMFKHDGDMSKLIMNNTVMAFTGPEMDGNHNQTEIMMGDAAYGGRHGEDLISCSNNYVLWLPDDNPPAVFSRLHSCFTVLTGTAAQNHWDTERCAWINAHPSSVTRRITAADVNSYNPDPDPETC